VPWEGTNWVDYKIQGPTTHSAAIFLVFVIISPCEIAIAAAAAVTTTAVTTSGNTATSAPKHDATAAAAPTAKLCANLDLSLQLCLLLMLLTFCIKECSLLEERAEPEAKLQTL
jgi:hypothetical protein